MQAEKWRKRLFYHVSAVCFVACGVLCPAGGQDELRQLVYHHPGLEVDLGVGLWAWPIPMDADADGDLDLVVSCPDKPSNGLWFFENAEGRTSEHRFPVFRPGRFLGRTVHYVMPSYVGGQVRILSPGYEYVSIFEGGLGQRKKLSVDASFHKPQGRQPKGPKVRHNQWRYCDYDADGRTDLIVAIEDWSFYGWDDAWDQSGKWVNGPLHGWVYVFLNRGSETAAAYEQPFRVQAGGRDLDVFGCPSPNFEDFDGDGDLDLICGEFLDGLTWFENVGSRAEPEYSAGVRLRAESGQPLVMDLQMIVPVAIDWDLDGDVDLVVGDEDGRVGLLENVTVTGQRGAPVFRAPVYFRQQAEALKCGALATPVGVDWDGDGDTDLVSGNTAGYVEVFHNLSGAGVAEPRWSAGERLRVGGDVFRVQAGLNGSIQGPAEAKWGYTTLSVADWDADGLPDIIYNSILGRVSWLKNEGTRAEPRFRESRPVDVEWVGAQPELAWGWLRPEGAGLLTQWRTTPVAVDLNRDGLMDLVMLDHEGYLAFFER
ncbi:MAG: FG-GAP repeat domain-containing protein, partial [Planctomycetaceae bacterium]